MLYQTRLEFSGPVDCYELHQRLWLAFTDIPRGERQPFLFRADVLPSGAALVTRTLLRSRVLPSIEALGEGVTVLSAPASFDPLAAKDAVLRFLLRANPTRAAKATHHALRDLQGEAFRSTRGKRVGLFGEDVRRAWLERQSERHGFSIVRVPTPEGDVAALAQRRPKLVRWSKDGNETPARHDAIDFEGLLRVNDPEAFVKALGDGIGPAKGLGFGLLSVRAP